MSCILDPLGNRSGFCSIECKHNSVTVHNAMIICKRQKKWQHCCILNSMQNSNSEVIFQEQKLDCAINMAKKLPVGKSKSYKNLSIFFRRKLLGKILVEDFQLETFH